MLVPARRAHVSEAFGLCYAGNNQKAFAVDRRVKLLRGEESEVPKVLLNEVLRAGCYSVMRKCYFLI